MCKATSKLVKFLTHLATQNSVRMQRIALDADVGCEKHAVCEDISKGTDYLEIPELILDSWRQPRQTAPNIEPRQMTLSNCTNRLLFSLIMVRDDDQAFDSSRIFIVLPQIPHCKWAVTGPETPL